MPGDLSTRISLKVIFCDRLQQHQMEFHYPPMPGQDAMQEEVWDGGRLLHVRKEPRFENVCVSQIYLQAALPGGMVNPLDKIGEPEDINIDVSQSRVTVRNADQQLSIALLGCCHFFICFLSYIFIPYFNSLVFV